MSLACRSSLVRFAETNLDGWETIMPERDGYIPGVPCWVDTSQPDPEAALSFYGGLFGWEFEDAMPEGSEGRYFMARQRGGDVAAVGSNPPGGRSRRSGTPTSGLIAPTRRRRRHARPAARWCRSRLTSWTRAGWP